MGQRWGWHVPGCSRCLYGATDELLLMLVEYINIGVLWAVERLRKGITGLQEECCEARHYNRLLHSWAIDGYCEH